MVAGSYVEVDPLAVAAASAGSVKGKGKGDPAAASAPTGSSSGDSSGLSRQQTRRLLINSILPSDGRPGSAQGTFELVLGKEAKDR